MAYGQGFYVVFKNTDLVVRKSDIVASKQQRFTQVWSFSKSDQRICYSHPGLNGKFQLANMSLELSRQVTNSKDQFPRQNKIVHAQLI